jgi:hypothetical protein
MLLAQAERRLAQVIPDRRDQERVTHLLPCPASALVRQIGWVEEGRISGSS